ncbi:hypothetical protein BCR44DRAFT_1431950 [Catenaria anguillulae PL171]|uniref:Transmembrane protein n=1 Tax=Catenaria anguillulae PL171 TaxID=765915 RepID=A0A1Y2HQP7_9FUNG|nr:hypothetical protein BCR44DRAFT_1431950 [Catenaria anguillulae PL171]
MYILPQSTIAASAPFSTWPSSSSWPSTSFESDFERSRQNFMTLWILGFTGFALVGIISCCIRVANVNRTPVAPPRPLTSPSPPAPWASFNQHAGSNASQQPWTEQARASQRQVEYQRALLQSPTVPTPPRAAPGNVPAAGQGGPFMHQSTSIDPSQAPLLPSPPPPTFARLGSRSGATEGRRGSGPAGGSRANGSTRAVEVEHNPPPSYWDSVASGR